jgi:hypothetical protein
VDWLNFIRGIPYSFLPKTYWGSWRPSSTADFTQSAIVSGAIEFALCVYLLFRGYLHFLFVRTHQLQAGATANEGTQLYFLALLSLEYAFHPFSLFCIYLSCEGALRMWAAFFTDEVIPSLPLRLIVFAQNRWKARREKEADRLELPDMFNRVEGENYEVHISSQRPKDGWRVSVTVIIEGEFYEIMQAEHSEKDHRFIYLLRKLPQGSVIRGMYRYEPPP